MGKVRVRYIVADVDAAIPFYTELLGFQVDLHPAPGFASLSRGALQLLLNRPDAGGAGQAMPDGQMPAPAMTSGYQKMYVDHVQQACEGADLDFLRGCRGAAIPRESH